MEHKMISRNIGAIF